MVSRGTAKDDVGDLVAELVDRWAPTFQSRSWTGRLSLLTEIHEQLLDDLGNFDVFAEVSPRFIAGLIDRLDEGPVRCAEQAHIYANSGKDRHRRLAGDWFEAQRKGAPPQPRERDRRARPRRVVNLPAAVSAEGRRVDCRLIDISETGALVEAPALHLPVGAEVDLELPSFGPAAGAVVRLAPPHFALVFRQPVDAATVH
jgi:hypothetical protein